MPLWVPGGVSNDIQSATFLETILLQALVKSVLNSLSLKRFVIQTRQKQQHFPFSCQPILHFSRTAGNVYVQRMSEKVVLFVLS